MKSICLLPFAAILALAQEPNRAEHAAVRPKAVLRDRADQGVLILKVGHAQFGSFSNIISSRKFTNLTEQLQTICAASHPSRNAPSGEGDWLRPINIDLALGSDYQILDWLDSGRIDAAVVSPTALQLHGAWNEKSIELVCIDAAGPAGHADVFHPLLRSFTGRHGELRPDPEGDYLAFLESLAAAPEASAMYRLVSPSHLSAAGFIAPVAYANNWLANRKIDESRPVMDEEFWESFFANLEFSLGSGFQSPPGDESGGGTIFIEFSSDSNPLGQSDRLGWLEYTNAACVAFPTLTNCLAVRREIAKEMIPARLISSILDTNSHPSVTALSGNEFLKKWIVPRFNISEAARLIEADQETSGINELSLVLSGGGVKAAYQSGIIDQLYGRRLVSNSSNPPAAVQVKSIVGNSGGALLGFFVAGLEDNDPRRLSEILWRPNDTIVTDGDIFGRMDLLRWASFVVCVWFFLWTVRLASWVRAGWPMLRDRLPACLLRAKCRGTARRPAAASQLAHHSLTLRYWLALLVILLVTPWLFQIVNGVHGREHIPPVEGLFYFFFLFLTMLIDNCIAPAPGSHDAAAPEIKRRFVPLSRKGPAFPPSMPSLVLMSGGVIALIPVGCELGWQQPWVTTLWMKSITVGGLVLCAGLLLLWIGVFWRLKTRPRDCVLQNRREYLLAVFLGVSVIVFAYLGLGLLQRLDLVTLLELTGAFWFWLILLTVILSIICFLIGGSLASSQRNRWSRAFGWIKVGLDFQLAEHPSRRFGLTRFVRMHLIFTAGFVYWNVLVAPALYGNAQARSYLQKVAGLFEQGAGNSTRGYALQTLYAAPANDLARDRERYFLFYPEAGPSVDSLEMRLANDVRQRWSVYDSSDVGHMKEVVFASGSPFPIFAPHRVHHDGDEKDEWLVDGGFAHNIPLEAAKNIGARQVLLLNSSPGGELFSAGQDRAGPRSRIGQLTRGLPRLVPFLFNRSQVADFLIRDELFIVSLAPMPPPEEKWPALFDFRASTVRRLLEVADADQQRRIGRIETAGPPQFLFSVRMERERIVN